MSRRQKQVNQTIRREISDLLTHQVNDPRIKGIISVTEVKISPDLTSARVFVSAMGTEEERAEIFAGLVAASGFLRREVGSRLKLRYTPELIFVRDDSIERGEQLLQLIDKVAGTTPDK